MATMVRYQSQATLGSMRSRSVAFALAFALPAFEDPDVEPPDVDAIDTAEELAEPWPTGSAIGTDACFDEEALFFLVEEPFFLTGAPCFFLEGEP